MFFSDKTKIWLACWKPMQDFKRFVHNLYHYFWCSTTPFIWINIFFLFFIGLAASKLVGNFPLTLLLVFLYICFLLFTYINFKGLHLKNLKIDGIEAKINAQKKAYEEEIRKGVAKDLKLADHNDPNLFFLPLSGKTCNCYFRKKLKLLIEQEVMVVYFGQYLFRIYGKCAAYNLLNPKLTDKVAKKNCAEAPRGCADNTEHYFSKIQNVSLEGGAIKIEFDTGSPVEIKPGTPAFKEHGKKMLEIIREKRRELEKTKQRDHIEKAIRELHLTVTPPKEEK